MGHSESSPQNWSISFEEVSGSSWIRKVNSTLRQNTPDSNITWL